MKINKTISHLLAFKTPVPKAVWSHASLDNYSNHKSVQHFSLLSFLLVPADPSVKMKKNNIPPRDQA